ncbi:MAG TPA: glycosyl hydrolase [Chloroflexia bacterium]|nr:glycosyl hydrolase [Chloroflexia bacterium]
MHLSGVSYKALLFRLFATLIIVLGLLPSASLTDDGRWTMDDGSSKFKVQGSTSDDERWTMDDGRWAMGDGRNVLYAARADDAEGRYYPQTGKTLAGQFLDFYDRYGGVLQFGYPVTDARVEEVVGGKSYLVQWTERQRLEYHPEYAGTQYEVLLGLLGRELTSGLEGPRFQAQVDEGRRTKDEGTKFDYTGESGNTSVYMPETGQVVAEPFLSYWRENGGLPIYGYPISSSYADETGLLIQWFERARFEYHPEYREHPVLLGHLGIETMKTLDVATYELQVHDSPAPDGPLRIDLAQGGESEDPHFLDNVREIGRELGPGLLRLDNIFNFYGIVERKSDGTVSYDWSKFDVAVDGVRAMGREPLICLSYMPETMSLSGVSRTMPPAIYEEWGALVRATVAHVNVERKLGVKYWEVWNEPDQWGFWQGSYPDYLRLYDTTVEAALAADPSVRIGGPAVSRFSSEHFEEFLAHEASRGSGVGGRVDFLSWHEYGQAPGAVAAHIREARTVLEKYPQFAPELFITEFNVLQGGAGDTSARGYTDHVEGAIALLASIEAMQRERLDRAFLFELKDGKGPASYWGRWGIVTNDGLAKPIYHTYKAYQKRPPGMLPISLRRGYGDGTLGMMAYGGPERATMFLWYTGEEEARVKVSLPAAYADRKFELTLFDATNNNPALSGDATLRRWTTRDAGDLRLDLKPDSLVLIESK